MFERVYYVYPDYVGWVDVDDHGVVRFANEPMLGEDGPVYDDVVKLDDKGTRTMRTINRFQFPKSIL